MKLGNSCLCILQLLSCDVSLFPGTFLFWRPGHSVYEDTGVSPEGSGSHISKLNPEPLPLSLLHLSPLPTSFPSETKKGEGRGGDGQVLLAFSTVCQ